MVPELEETPNVFCVQQVMHNSYFVAFSSAASSQFSTVTDGNHMRVEITLWSVLRQDQT